MKGKIQKIFAGVLTLCLILTMVCVPQIANAANNEYMLELTGSPTVNRDENTYEYADGTVKVNVNGVTRTDGTIDLSVHLNDSVEIILTAKAGKTGILMYGGMSDPGNEPKWTITSGQTPEGLEVTTYTFKAADVHVEENDVLSLTCEFRDAGGNTPGGSEEAPTDAISVELWDNLGNMVDYDIYRSTVSPAPGMPVIGATIEYSYDKTNWHELPYAGSIDSDNNISFISNRYVFENWIDRVYIRVVNVTGGLLKSRALECQTDGVMEWGGPVENGKIYTLSNPGVCDFIYDSGERTIVWSDDASKYGTDGTVEHGSITIRSAVDAAGKDVLNDKTPYSQSGKEGHVSIPAGATVTVEVKPDYGYQFVAGSLNGTQIKAESEVSVFTFTMPSTNLHLTALFTAVPDKVDVSAKDVTAGTISGGDGIITSGNLKLTVTDSAMSEAQKTAMAESTAAANVTITNWLDIKLDQIINKGTETDVWTNSLTELSKKIKITLSVGKNLDTAKEYVVVREHNGVYEQIPAVYDAKEGTITFETDRFSQYALGTVSAYTFLEGADGSVVSGSGEYTMRVDGEFSKFASVEVDGKVVDAKNYTAKSGSTIITFTKEYIASLSAGSHTVRVNFTDGYAETKLTVKKTPETPTTEASTTAASTTATNTTQKAPKTGDTMPVGMLGGIMMLAGIGAVVTMKKRK